jgi:hypothetical protein
MLPLIFVPVAAEVVEQTVDIVDGIRDPRNCARELCKGNVPGGLPPDLGEGSTPVGRPITFLAAGASATTSVSYAPFVYVTSDMTHWKPLDPADKSSAWPIPILVNKLKVWGVETPPAATARPPDPKEPGV